jgi:CrcB protein
MLWKLLLIGVGGGIGSVLRYLVAGWGQSLTDSAFPLGTLIVNVSGCLLVGFLGALLTGSVLVREEHRIAILIGVLGGYTTFSTFGRETFLLAGDREYMFALLNLLLSNGLGLTAVWLGHRAAERWFGAAS